MSQVAARKFDVRCFIEGIEVPCVSAAESVNIDAPATCVVQCIPTASCTRLKPRTGFHIFFKDLTDQNGPYRLYFSGELVSYQYAKTPNNLAIMYQLVDDSSYWDTAYQYFVDYGRGADWLFQQKSSFMGTGNALFDSVFREHASVIAGLLRTSPKTYPQLRGLVGGVVHVLEAVGGVQGKFRGFNDFFTMAEMRRKILAQVSASEADETSIRIYNHKVFWQWIMRQLGSVGSMVSMRDMIKLLFRYIFHNVVPNPIAKYDPEGQQDIRTTRYQFANTARGKKVSQNLLKVSQLTTQWQKRATEFLNRTISQVRRALKMATRDGSRKKAIKNALHVAYDKAIKDHKVLQNQLIGYRKRAVKLLNEALKQSKGVTRAEGQILAAIGRIKTLFIFTDDIRLEGLNALHPVFWENMFLLYGPSEKDIKASNDGSSPLFSTRRFELLSPGDRRMLFYVNIDIPQDYRIFTPPQRVTSKMDQALDSIQKAVSALGLTLRLRKDVTPRERLHSQIMRPDIWFVAPPKCNVIFPDDYISFQYNRSFLQELTRMELTTAMELIGSNSITNSRYFAPNIEDITGKYVLQSARSGVRLIMPHEIYTGILPNFQFMSEANIYAATADQKKAIRDQKKLIQEQAKYLQQQAQQLRSGKINRDNADTLAEQYERRVRKLEVRAKNLSTGGIPYIQRAVNFMFFKQRFASRSMGLQGNFLWRLVAGFPGLVINKPSTGFDDKPPQFLGMVAGLQHTVTQEGNTSQVTFSQSREHGGLDDDFLGLEAGVTQAVRAGSSKTTKIVTDLLDRRLQARNKRLVQLASIQNPTASQKRITAKVSKDLAKLEKMSTFIKNYEQRRARGLSEKGMRGPNGGIVVSVKAYGAKKGPKVSERYKTLIESRKLQQKNLGGLITQADLDETDDKITQIVTSRGGLTLGVQYHERYVVKEAYPTIRKKISLPPEEQIYPTWMSPIYRNENIGRKKVNGRQGPYQQFFGCGAITDDPGDTGASRKAMEQDLQDPTKTVEGALKPSKSIAEAVDELVQVYEKVRTKGLDVRTFIDQYTHRPVATMEEMLGTSDLVVGEDGTVQQGKAGFHSFAFGDYQNLEGFRDAKSKLAGGRGQQAKVARGLDTRRKKRQVVLQYRKELNRGVGQLGG